jgi:glycosyltransferase involved in cell wall biosynthesis
MRRGVRVPSPAHQRIARPFNATGGGGWTAAREKLMKISACLIVKNEEKTLARCLESIRDHVDEIVVVDTGSCDRTKEIACSYKARILNFPWRHDFAAARQYSFDHASGDWLFWLDADDVVHNAGRIRSAAAEASADLNCFYWKYQASHDQYGKPTCEFWRERCVRNDSSYRWCGRVHEVLVPRSRAVTCRDEEVLVVHHRELAGRNPRRNLEILQLEYARSRGRTPPRLLYHLGSEYADLADHEAALQYLRRYVKVSRWRDEKYLAFIRIADLERLEGRFDGALSAACHAFDLIPAWPTACFSLAETYYFQKDWTQVVRWSEDGRDRPFPQTVCITNPNALRYSWIIYYTNALFHLGRITFALEWTKKALEMCPSDEWHKLNFEFFSEQLVTQQAHTDSSELPPVRNINPAPATATPVALPEVAWYGPLFDPSGYAEEGREFVMGMDAIGFHIRAVPYEWCSRKVDLPPTELAVMNRLVQTPASEPAVSVYHIQPVHWQRRERGGYHIGRTMCETDRIPECWVNPCNAMDEVWVPSQHNIETFAGSGVDRRKLVKMPQGINTERYKRGVPPLTVRGARNFNFLSIFEWSRHKGWDVLLRAFAAEFRPHENVALILKTGAVGGETVLRIRQAIICELRAAGLSVYLPPNIVILAGKLAAEQMPALYRAADAFVLPSRGEGWCRPLMEAMLMGLPSIATRWSGPLEFMNDDNAYLVDCTVVDVPPAGWRDVPVFRGHRWAEPSVRQLRDVMRRVVSEREEAHRKGELGCEHIVSNFSRERVARIVQARLEEILGR